MALPYTPRIFPEDWQKDRNLALVFIRGKPAEIVAEFGTNSISRNVRRAAVTAEAPEALHLLNVILECLTEEEMQGYEAHIDKKITYAIQACLERATGKRPEIQARKLRPARQLTPA